MFLPKDVRQTDVIEEIAEHLQSRMEEHCATLERPMTEAEQERLFNDYGSPMVVAGRYGGGTRRLAFGGVLIGPELFPLYVRILLLNWAIAIGIHALLAFVFDKPAGLGPFVTTVVAQFFGLTLTFSIIDRLQRRARQRWYFPPAYLQPVPRWQSAYGLAAWIAAIACWIAVPFVPSLVLGRAAADVQFAAGSYDVYWPVLLLLAASATQRAVNLARPDWNWLLPAARLAINAAGLMLLYFMASRYPYFAAADPAATAERLQQVTRLNDLLWWAVAGVSPFYFLTNLAINGWFTAQHLGYLRRCRQTGAPVRA